MLRQTEWEWNGHKHRHTPNKTKPYNTQVVKSARGHTCVLQLHTLCNAVHTEAAAAQSNCHCGGCRSIGWLRRLVYTDQVARIGFVINSTTNTVRWFDFARVHLQNEPIVITIECVCNVGSHFHWIGVSPYTLRPSKHFHQWISS